MTATTAMELSNIWKQIETGLGTASTVAAHSIFLRPTKRTLPDGKVVLAGLDARGGQHLLVPISPETLRVVDDQSRGVLLQVRELLDDKDVRGCYLDITGPVAALGSLFATVASEILDACLVGIAEGTGAVEAAVTALGRWRDLLDMVPSRKLGSDDLAALLGELIVLQRLVQQPSDALALWTGPKHLPHDFTSSAGDIEVKTTRSRERSVITIHGLTQLTPVEGRPLYLAFIRLFEDPAGMISVPDVIDQLVAGGFSRLQLLTVLATLGYDASDEEDYREVRFIVDESRLYSVAEGFPRLDASRLINGVLDNGVGVLRYQVDLAVADAFRLSEVVEHATYRAIGEAAVKK